MKKSFFGMNRGILAEFLLTLTLAFVLGSCASRQSHGEVLLTAPPDLFTPMPFLENQSHLALNVSYPPIESLRRQIESQIGFELKTRGEAHITVLTPPEYDHLKSHLSMEKINEFARAKDLQHLSWKPICVGRGRLQIDGREESTYFLVVESKDLLNFREELQKAALAAGGHEKDFNPRLFFPHITIGYTKRDLHYEDGVLKDATSCLYGITTEQN